MAKRKIEESNENVSSTIAKGAPDTKFQDSQQVTNVSTIKPTVADSSFIAQAKEPSGNKLKQEVVSELVKGSAAAGAGNSGDGSSFSGRSVSGEVAGVAGYGNSTPTADRSRSDSRVGKKLDRNTTKLNFIPSEQYYTEIKESKPLAEAVDADQGYNGTYRNKNARIQKNSGAVPADPLFDRSAQLITRDEVYFGQGQQISVEGAPVLDDSLTVTVDAADGETENIYEARQNGNFITRGLRIAFHGDGAPRFMAFDEENVTPYAVNTAVANKSSVARTSLMNDAEIVREMIDSKAGDEKADLWSPLARAVQQPTQTVGFLRDLEAETGNEILTAYRKSNVAHAFQLNRAHLDGQNTVAPALTYLAGLRRNDVSLDYQNNDLGHAIRDVFDREHYVNGDASTMIALYDSLNKYNSKADVLSQPRSIRMHLQTADNNIDPFHCDATFVQAFSAIEAFSTIDRAYDGTMPTMMTDKAAVIHKNSWNDLGGFIRGSEYRASTAGQSDARQDYVLIPGQLNSIMSGQYVHGYSNGAINCVDGVFSSTAISGNDQDVIFVISNEPTADPALDYDNHAVYACGATIQDVIVDCTYITVPVAVNRNMVYGTNCGPAAYSYSDLRNNYIVVMRHPLLFGLDRYFCDTIGSKYRGLLTDGAHSAANGYGDAVVYIPPIHSSMYASLWSLLLCAATPYIIRERINTMRDVIYYEENVAYPFSTTLVGIKEATTKAFSNFTFTDIDHELIVGTMTPSSALTWILPELTQRVAAADGNTAVVMPWYSNEEDSGIEEYADYQYDAAVMSMPSIRAGVTLKTLDDLYGITEKDIRLCCDMISCFRHFSELDPMAYKYSLITDGQFVAVQEENSIINLRDWLSAPRQIGRYFTAPYGLLTPMYDGHYAPFIGRDVCGESSYKLTYWTGHNPVTHVAGEMPNINEPAQINVNRGQNFTMPWFAVLASGTAAPFDHGFVTSVNALFNAANGAPVDGMSAFIPFTPIANGEDAGITTRYRSIQKAMWFLIQKLPFIISPFDLVREVGGSTIINDPFDLAYALGLAGFRASDFRESVYNRSAEIVNQGMLFVKDPWISASPIFKDGSMVSGVYTQNSFT